MPRLTALSKSRRLAIRRIPRCAPAPFSHQHSSFQPVSAESPMRAQTQAAQWLQGEFDSFDTTGLPFTPLVNFSHNFGIWSASLQLSKVKRRLFGGWLWHG